MFHKLKNSICNSFVIYISSHRNNYSLPLQKIINFVITGMNYSFQNK